MHRPLGPLVPPHGFGPFLADTASGRLYHGTREVPLTPKSFKVLVALLEMKGQLVSREDLFQQVWPDTFVEPNNLARNISMIRKALHECDPEHEYIVTVTGRGYRFVAPVTLGDAASAIPPAVSSADVSSAGHAAGGEAVELGLMRSAPFSFLTWRAAAVLTALVSLVLVAVLLTRPDPPPPPESETESDRHLTKLTSASRFETQPTWSPDGRWIAYSSDRAGNFDIWIQPLGDGRPMQITFDGGREWQPSWSPDGRTIAFRSERDGGGLFVVPAFGGEERRIADFGFQPQWSPDASRILFSDAGDLFTVGLDGALPTRVINDGLAAFVGRYRAAWHPDGGRVSVYGIDRNHGPSFWTFPIGERHPSNRLTPSAAGGSSRRAARVDPLRPLLLTMRPIPDGEGIRSQMAETVARRLREAEVRLGGFVWAPGGDALYFEGRSAETANIWRVRVNPSTLEWISGPDRLTMGSSLESGIALSPDGRRLAFGSRTERTVAWSLPFDPVSGRIIGEGTAVTPEGLDAEILDLSPDGSQLAYRVASQNRHELWIRSLDRQADHLRTVEVGAAIVQPRWSRDGTQLAYLRRPADPQRAAAVVLLTAQDDGQQRVVPAARSPEMVYDWSLDGRSFLVRCRGNQTFSAICRLANTPATDTAPDMHLVAADARRNLYAAKHSPDGRWVSFIAAADLTRSTVFVSPAGGGAWIPITPDDDRYFEDKPRWSPDGRTLYFLSNRNGFWNLWGRRFDPERGWASGAPFQVSRFDSSLQMVRENVADVQIAITSRRLILPVTQTSGAVWVLENVDR
jgi:Tol biopolymer transport system component/DNA-binding winged helix-turn-helix (wHTH) protein